MVEVLVASAFVAGGAMAAARLGQPTRASGLDRAGRQGGFMMEDLPCPWCQAATNENDTRCPSCHQRFG